MYVFEYTIELNEFGRPVITPSKKTDKELDLVEHKFLGLELGRTLVHNILSNSKRPLSPEEFERLQTVHNELERICDIFALSIKEQMEVMDETKALLTPQVYDLQVGTIDELHGLNYDGIIYGDQIFRRKEGLRVMVMINKKIYELRGGIDNEHWFDTSI